MIVKLSFLFPSKWNFNSDAQIKDGVKSTFNRVCLDELCAIGQQSVWYALPCHRVRHAEIDMGRGELVNVKPDVLWPSVLDELFIYKS